MMATVLCVEAAEDRDALRRGLLHWGHTPIAAGSVVEARDALQRHTIDVIVAAESMVTSIAGHAARAGRPDFPPLIVLRPHARPERGLDATPSGAVDALTTPLRRESIRMAIERALEHRDRRLAASREPPPDTERSALVGHSPALRPVLAQAWSLAHRDVPVLVVGEPGVGKTLLAQQVHARGPRRNRPVVLVPCGASSAWHLREILFGSDGDDAVPLRTPGAVHRARHGSLLIEAITELDASTQCRLMDELSRGACESERRSAPRLIATAECGPSETPERWRESVVATRMGVSVLRVPPLRERLEDLPLLVGHFVHDMARRLGIRPPEVLPDAVTELERRGWPGNVRELRNAVERAVIVGRSRPLDACAFHAPRPPFAARDPLRRGRVLNLRRIERAAILAALRESSGHQGRAARLLGISTRTLRRRLQDRSWGIDSARRVRRRALAAIGTPSPRDIGSGRRGPGATSAEDRDGNRERARPDSGPVAVTRSRTRGSTSVAEED